MPGVPSILQSSDVSSVSDWIIEVKRKGREAGYTAGQFTLYNIDDGHDDSNFRPTTQLAIEKLKDRFLLRLAMAFGNGGAWNSPTVAMLREADQGKTASIRLLRKCGSGNRTKNLDLPELAQKIAQRLQSIRYLATENYSLQYEALYNTVCRLYMTRMVASVSQLRILFKENKEKIDNMISIAMGLLSDETQAYDTTLSEQLLTLNIAITVLPPDTLYKYTELAKVMGAAHQLYYQGGTVQKRLREVLGTPFADSLYNVIKTLSQPKACTDTFSACARMCKSFAKVDFGYGLPSMSTTIWPSPHDNDVNTALNRNIHSSRPNDPIQSIPAEHHPTDSPQVLTQAQEFLDPADQYRAAKSLEPAAKRRAYALATMVLEGRVPDPKSNDYFLFGFVACNNDQAVRNLGQHYARSLKDAEFKTNVFSHLWQALHSNSLPEFFDIYNNSISVFPNLKDFLNTPIEDRPSIYRLVQFLRVREGTSVDTNPIACGGRNLIRDFGFHLCKGREEVELLKAVYRQSLMKLDISDLHQACVQMRLRETIIGANVKLDERCLRLLQNQGPLPDLGYEKITSQFLFSQGLFKGDRKKDRAACRIW